MCAQRRLRSAWAFAQSDQPSLCAQWVAKDPSFLHADSKDSDQSGWMPMLIWAFAGRTFILLVLLWCGSNITRKRNYIPILGHLIVDFSKCQTWLRNKDNNYWTLLRLGFWYKLPFCMENSRKCWAVYNSRAFHFHYLWLIVSQRIRHGIYCYPLVVKKAKFGSFFSKCLWQFTLW